MYLIEDPHPEKTHIEILHSYLLLTPSAVIFMNQVLGPEEQWRDFRIFNHGNNMVRNVLFKSSHFGSVVMNLTRIVRIRV